MLFSSINQIRMGVYSIGYRETDETQFFAANYEDLRDLWEDFCDENDIDYHYVDYVECEETDVDIFEEYLERTGATVYKGCSGWVVNEGGYDSIFCSWYEMIEHMNGQNEEMRG